MVKAKTDDFGLMTSKDMDDIEGKELQDNKMIVSWKGNDDVFLFVVEAYFCDFVHELLWEQFVAWFHLPHDDIFAATAWDHRPAGWWKLTCNDFALMTFVN